MDNEREAQTRQLVKEQYGKVARGQDGCCTPSCCDGGQTKVDAVAQSVAIGYDPQQLASVPEEANLGLGCGNPTALASLQEGQVVLDLGSGGGLDALLAADKVGKTGRVIGVDMTPEMLARARANAVKAGVADRVEFREGIIERLPVVDGSVDVVVSNCVINLSPDKPAVFREAARVLKPGGRLVVSDILLTEPLPETLKEHVAVYAGCIGGASLEQDYLRELEEAGFVDIRYARKPMAPLLEGMLADPTVAQVAELVGEERLREIAHTVYSYQIEARKP